jgi:MFS family permease
VTKRLPIFYGWIVVATITTILVATSGARLLFGVVLKPLSEEFGWSRSELGLAITINMIVLSLLQPSAGWLTDKVGPRKVMVGGTALIALTLLTFSFAGTIWQVYLIYGFLGGISFLSASPVNATALVNRWFVRRRGMALSIASAGTPVGQLLVIPVAVAALEVTDWRTTYRLLAALLIAMVPLGAWLLRNDPADVGEIPDGRGAVRFSPDGSVSTIEGGRLGISDDATAATLRQALRSSAFWFLAYGFVACGFTMAFANAHFLAYADDMGMHSSVASTAISVTAAFSIAGTILLGVLADRTERAPVLALTYALRGVAFMLLYAVESGPLVYLYAIVLGVSWSATTPLTAAIAADLYGRRHLGVIFGTMFTAMNLGFGLGAYFDGLVYDALGHYHPALVVNGLVGLSAAAAIYLADVGRTPRLRPIVIEPRTPVPVVGN